MGDPRSDRPALEIESEASYGRSAGWARTAARITLFAFVGVAAMGVFGGGGVLSHAEVGPPGRSLVVSYDRFARVGTPAHLRIASAADSELSPTRAASGRAPAVNDVWLAESLVEAIDIETTTPPPDQVSMQDDRLLMHYTAGVPRVVILRYFPRRAGRLHGMAGVGPHTIRFTQFVLF